MECCIIFSIIGHLTLVEHQYFFLISFINWILINICNIGVVQYDYKCSWLLLFFLATSIFFNIFITWDNTHIWRSVLVFMYPQFSLVMWTWARCLNFMVPYLLIYWIRCSLKIPSSTNPIKTSRLRNHMGNKYCGQSKNPIPSSFHWLDTKKYLQKYFLKLSRDL